MQTQQSTFQSHDGLEIHTYSYCATEEPRAVVLITHGYGEHMGRYEHVILALVEQGYAVYGLDHRGHGYSDGARALFRTLDDPLQDMRRVFDQARADYPDHDIFMLGHSMGSLLTLAFALKYEREIAGIIVTGVATHGGQRVSPIIRRIGETLMNVVPQLPIQPPGPPTDLNSDPVMLQKWEDDPLNYKGWWKVGMGGLLIRKGEEVAGQVHRLTLPMLIMHGSEDVVTPIDGSYHLHQVAASDDKTLKVWNGMKHEVLNEVERDQVFAVLLSWLDAH